MRLSNTTPLLAALLLATSLVAGPAAAGEASQLNINTADASSLSQAINGVGIKRAQAIIAYREAHGPFKSVEDLARVDGIGAKIVERSRDRLTAGAP